MGHGKDMETRALNEADARVGDTVALESDTSRMLGYAALVFLVPILALLGGYLVSELWTSRALYRYLCGVAAFALTFVGIRIWSERVIKRRSEVRVVKVIRTSDGQDMPE
jgi:positive regulator of sigma E activity